MPSEDRNWAKGEHPPACTCVDCVKRRLDIIRNSKGNQQTKKNGSSFALNIHKPSNRHLEEHSEKNKNLLQIKFVLWLLLFFALSVLSIISSIYIRSSCPFWIILGFSFFYSIEKWFKYYVNKYKILGIIYRSTLNIVLLTVLGLAIYSGYFLFNRQPIQSPLEGSLLLILELIFFIYLWRITSKNSFRQPSMKLTIFSLFCLFLILAFAGVNPMDEYKDNLIGRFTDYIDDQKENPALNLGQATQISKNTENKSENIISKAIDTVSDLWDISIEDYAIKFNQYRQSKGLKILTFTDDLNRVAELRLKELPTDFSHYSEGNYNNHLAENIVMSTGGLSNSDALRLWQNSLGHNANMLDSSYKYTGYAIGNGYAVQLFSEFPTLNGEPQLPPGWYWDE